MRPLTMPRLSIVIVTYNSARDVEACIESLAGHRPAVDHEIVVVDNASPDGTAAATRARWSAVRVFDAGGNLGFARANNIGIRQTFGELVLLLNPDTIVPAGAIDALVRVLDTHPEAAVAGPRLIDADGRAELSFGRMIAPLAELRQKLLVVGHDRRLPGISHYVERLTRRARTVDWVSGACLLVRRADAEAVGLLDERYFMYAEDVDFCAAIRARGRSVLFAPAAEVRHLRGRSAATLRSATSAAYRRSQLAFYAKHHPGWVPFLRFYLRLTGR
jgi:GT2 family glycosyltransferase